MKKILIALLLILAFATTLTMISCGESDTPSVNEPSNQDPPADPAKKDIEGITFSSAEFTYDGTEKTITVTGTLPEGVICSYENASGTDAGVYEAKATLSGEGYNTKQLTATLTINKASYDMSNAKWSYTDSFVYNGEEKSITVVGLPEGVTVKEYSNASATDAGSYTAKATLSYDEKNYLAPSITDIDWLIEKATIIGITIDDAKFEYDAMEHSIRILHHLS